MELKTCRGRGGQAAKNGLGGAGKSTNDNKFHFLITFRSVLFHCHIFVLNAFPLTPFPFLDFSVVYHQITKNINVYMNWSIEGSSDDRWHFFFRFSGGQGGRGGRGIKCRRKEKRCSNGFVFQSCSYWCKEDGRLGEAPRGPDGSKGRDGQGL